METPTILYEDMHMMAVDKPSGMIVNDADTTQSVVTLQQWATPYIDHMTHVDNDLSGYSLTDEFRSRGGIVHRLDKETSGVILIAKTAQAFANLKSQFMARTVRKHYTALAHGILVPKEGTINAPIGRQEFNRMRFGVVAGGREAVTDYQVSGYYALSDKKKNKQEMQFTLVEAYPKTGRTHQIRVHFKHLGHPLVSDELYAGRKTARDDRKLLPRIFLHAASLTYTHPVSTEAMDISAPLSAECVSFLSRLVIVSRGGDLV